METILITGGSGLIGTALCELLSGEGYQVIVLTRSPSSAKRKFRSSISDISFAAWDIKKGTIDEDAFRKADHIVHLAGAGVADKRWSARRKKEIVNSRIKSGELLLQTLRTTAHKVKTIVSSSAIGWYGPDPSIPNLHPFRESDPPDSHFLGETCRLWEESIRPATGLGIRLVILRTGIVFSAKRGAFPEFKKPLRLGLAAILGNGRQVVSWIHIDDICRIYLAAIERTDMQGVYNAVAPEPVSNKMLIQTMARVFRGKNFISLHVPRFAIKIALGEMSVEVLKSATVSCDKLKDTGFDFLYPSLDSALNALNHG
ncbi:MAG TPA: TIGR01777 family oxidoreductase [Flavitalea sp.]|nr:TIGR01777 family oxidoreductase [Flavitalea sp.]